MVKFVKICMPYCHIGVNQVDNYYYQLFQELMEHEYWVIDKVRQKSDIAHLWHCMTDRCISTGPLALLGHLSCVLSVFVHYNNFIKNKNEVLVCPVWCLAEVRRHWRKPMDLNWKVVVDKNLYCSLFCWKIIAEHDSGYFW